MSGNGTINRRSFLFDLGKSTVGIAVFGLTAVACTDDAEPAATTLAPAPTSSTATATTTTTPPVTEESTTTEAPAADPRAVAWQRVILGSVSAYVLVRNGEAAVVDTGNAGSAPDIENALAAVGLGWDAVGHLIVTHSHPDHQGSLVPVLEAAAGATGYAGAADIPAITSPSPLVAVGDGDRVFDLEIIETPGHTPGHISVLDRAGGLLVAGDALNGNGGNVIGPNPRFSSDMDTANQSVTKIAGFAFETVLFGHGEPVEGGASAAVAALAADLQSRLFIPQPQENG